MTDSHTVSPKIAAGRARAARPPSPAVDGLARFEDAWLDLLPTLAWIDGRLEAAMDAIDSRDAAPADGSAPAVARGSLLVRREFARVPGGPRFGESATTPPEPRGRLRELADWAGLTPFDCTVVALTLAVELDGRYAQACAWLQDDAAASPPGKGLVLDLFAVSVADSLMQRARLRPPAPLFGRGLLRAVDDALPWLSQPLRLDPAVTRYLLGEDDLANVDAALASHAQADLERLARRVPATQSWDDIVLPEDTREMLAELCAREGSRHRVLGDWKFADKFALGRGTSALFAGPSGTGKTMSAGILANALGQPLYRIDLAQVVNKYIGETEKNLDRIFDAAHAAGAILFFDEADALFGKRAEVKDAHDRYANLEVGYLLQKMEEYEGLAILATNLRQNLDEAFLRRLSFIIEFPFPDEADRRRIWSALFPPAAPLADDVDFDWLAREVRLSGGHLRNIALAAAYLAATDGGAIRQRHLVHAARREHRKFGKNWQAG